MSNNANRAIGPYAGEHGNRLAAGRLAACCRCSGMGLRILWLATLTALWSASAAAQTTLPFRAYVSIDGAHQGAPDDFRDSATFVENAEDGQLVTDYRLTGGPAFNVSGGAAVWRQLGVGVAFSRFSRSSSALLNAAVPHPFFFDRDRTVEGEVSGLKREEMAVHIRATGVLPVGNRAQVLVFGGPTFFRVKQGIVTDFTYTDAYPFDTASFQQGQTISAEESTIGFNAGADVAFFFTQQLGVGGMVQFTGATLDLPSAGGGTQEVKTGGLQVGGGLRLRF